MTERDERQTDFELLSCMAETPDGTKNLIFDVDGDLDEIQTAEKSQSLQEIKRIIDERIGQIQHMIDLSHNAEHCKVKIQQEHKMRDQIQKHALLKASA